MLINIDINEVLLSFFKLYIISSGLIIEPTHEPFTNTFVVCAKYFGLHSCNNNISYLFLNKFIIGIPEHPLVIFAVIDKCLCVPIFAPSGVSIGSIIPH